VAALSQPHHSAPLAARRSRCHAESRPGNGRNHSEGQSGRGKAGDSPGQRLYTDGDPLHANQHNTGAAIVVFPGGSYRRLAIDLEGTEVCDWLNSIGITCVLLKYRVPDSGPYPKSAAALQDAQRALGIVRSHAADWHIDSHRIGVLGFSAGAHLAAALSTHHDQRLYDPIDAADQLSCRPDFAIILYPGYLALSEQNFAPNPEIHPTEQTPPSFIAQAEDDPVHVENSTVYFLSLKNAKVPVEMHLYAQGGHGFGLRRTAYPVTTWPQEVETWLHTIQILPPTAP
jgi:acetyl esterase/lipase